MNEKVKEIEKRWIVTSSIYNFSVSEAKADILNLLSLLEEKEKRIEEEFSVIFDGSDIEIDIYCGGCNHWFGKLIGATVKSKKEITAVCPICKQIKPVVFNTTRNPSVGDK